MISKIKLLLNLDSYRKLSYYANGYKLKIMYMTIINMLISSISVGIALITKAIIDTAINTGIKSAVYHVIIFTLLLLLLTVLSSYYSYKIIRIKTSLLNKLELDFMTTIYNKDWLLISKINSGDLSAHLYNDLSKIVNSITSIIPTLFALSLQLLLGFTFLAFYDLTLAIIIITITPITIIFSLLVGTKLKPIQRNIQDSNSDLWSKTSESISNLTILKTFNYTQQSLTDIDTIQQRKFGFIKKRSNLRIKVNILLDLGYYIGFFAAIIIGSLRLSSGVITFGTLAAFLQLIDRIQSPLENMSSQLPQLISSFSSVDRVESIYSICSEKSILKVDTQIIIPQQIHLRNVSYSYNENSPILENINLTINAGDKIAIVGTSGEGKTTLINLLLALISPITGQIIITSNDFQEYEINSNTRYLFSYVSQRNMLFTGTIRENFLLTTPVSETEIEKALSAACCDSFVNQLENGIDTLIFEDGLGLSQGQLQRLSIARALLHNRPILIFDEASSSLDEETEHKLFNNINKYYKNVTLFAITHRQKILSICNRIYRMENHHLFEEK